MKPLTKPLQTRINRLAHRIAAQQDPRIKCELLEQLQTALDAMESECNVTAET